MKAYTHLTIVASLFLAGMAVAAQLPVRPPIAPHQWPGITTRRTGLAKSPWSYPDQLSEARTYSFEHSEWVLVEKQLFTTNNDGHVVKVDYLDTTDGSWRQSYAVEIVPRPDGQPDTTFSYFESAFDSTILTTRIVYTYDSLDNPVVMESSSLEDTGWSDAYEWNLTYVYGDNGRIESMNMPWDSADTIVYEYDYGPEGQLSTISGRWELDSVATEFMVNYEYRTDGQLSQATMVSTVYEGNGLVSVDSSRTVYIYDDDVAIRRPHMSRARLSNVRESGARASVFDPMGRRVTATHEQVSATAGVYLRKSGRTLILR